MTEPATTEAQQGQETQGAEGQQATPPWGSDENFNPEKAWKLIQDLRSDKEKLAARPVLTDEQKTMLDEYDKIQQAAKTDLDKATEQVNRWQTEAETWRAASVNSKIEALAATDFEYPADAVDKLKDNNYLDAGGTIDEAAIRRDLEKLLEERPKYRRDSSGEQRPTTPRPNPHQGSSGSGRATPDPAQEFAAIMQDALRKA